MRWFISFLAIGAVALGIGYDRRRQRERSRVARPEIHRWEEEGGAVPNGETNSSIGRPAAQTTTH
jgi:hypothetical protein